MTVEELKEEARKLGYNIAKKPVYDCSCWAKYPNKYVRKGNGKWKCVDCYEPIGTSAYGKTMCVRKHEEHNAV